MHFDVEYDSEGFFINHEIYRNAPLATEVDWNHTQFVNGYIKITWQNRKSFHVEFLEDEYLKVTPIEEPRIMFETPDIEKSNFLFGEWVELPFSKFRINLVGSEKSGTLLMKFRDRESLILKYTGENLVIAPTDKIASILLFSLETEQPQKGRDYLDLLMKVFLNNELNKKNEKDINTIGFIDSQLSGISDSLTNTENKLEKFQSSHGTYNITSEGTTIFEKLSESY